MINFKRVVNKIEVYNNFWWDYGNSRFVCLDSGDDYLGVTMQGEGLWQYQIDYLNALLPGHSPNYVFMHHTALDIDELWYQMAWWNTSIAFLQNEFLNTCRANSVELVLTGHTHIDEIYDDYNKELTKLDIICYIESIFLIKQS